MSYKIGIIGYGNMGSAIITGAIRTKFLKPEEVIVYDYYEPNLNKAKNMGFVLAKNSVEVANTADILMLAIKPQNIESVLEEIKNIKVKCILSIVAGVSIKYIQSYLPSTAVIRTMPNTPLQIGEGATAICFSNDATKTDCAFVSNLFESTGSVATITEEQMDPIMCVNGSTPAYVYFFIDCLLKDAVKNGIDENVARKLLIKTFIGSAKLLEAHPEKPLDDFIDEVCSKGGTTIEAIEEMRRCEVGKIIKQADDKCIARAKVIGK